ncbi:hypothetical protein, partial [Klebsiella aerogenes]|uniref:hypothetical protein n=2 Tax=Klebsiella TaxID=570 RepID=UPI00069E6F56
AASLAMAARLHLINQLILAILLSYSLEVMLLFLTDDVPYEEALKIVLLDVNDGVKEILTLGGAYLTDSFTDLKIHSNSVEFSFIGDTTWRVEIPLRPFIQLPFTGDPRGVSRPLMLKHYIKICAHPAPARFDGSR